MQDHLLNDLEAAHALLGGTALFGRPVHSLVDVHDLLTAGLPIAALHQLADRIAYAGGAAELAHTVGIDPRTLWRHGWNGPARFDLGESNRIWSFARILARAIAVFGSTREAVAFMERPAPALAHRRPASLVATPVGLGLVADHLAGIRLEVDA